jgi:outer membrane protein assembly factor BamB
MGRSIPWLAIVVAFAGAIDRCIEADDWPQWRGPQRDAVSRETGLLTEWPDGGPPIAWRTSNLGTGYASVVVSRNRVYTIGQHDADLFATALSESDGSISWSRKIGETTRNSCSTPTVDDERMYALDPDGELVCLDLAAGDTLWQRSFVDEFGGRMMSGRGYGESPLVDGERLICSPGRPDAAVVALNKRTGEVVWMAKVPEIGTAGRDGMGFSSIVVTEVAGIRQYVQLLGRGLVGIEADTGRWLWGYNGISNDTANIPTPVVRGDLVFAANGYNAGSVLLRIAPEPGADPKTANWRADVVYRLTGSQFQNHHGGVALVGDDLYGGHGSNNGLPTCLEFATGNVLWKQRGPGVGSAAVVVADGRLYFRYQNGIVALIEAGKADFQVRGTMQVPEAGGDSWAHPVVANGRLYLREQDVLWVYDVRRNPTAAPQLADESTAGPPWPAPLVALRDLGVTVEGLSDKSPALYQYVATDESHDGPLAYIVKLHDRQLDAEGALTVDCLAGLRAVEDPLILDFSGTRVTASGLAQLASLHEVVGLDLALCRHISETALAKLQPLSDLRVLVLAGTGVSAVGLKELAPLTQLTALDLEVCDAVDDMACEQLRAFPQLRALVLKKTGFEKERLTDVGLEHLSHLSNLQSLNLYGNNVSDAGLASAATRIAAGRQSQPVADHRCRRRAFAAAEEFAATRSAVFGRLFRSPADRRGGGIAAGHEWSHVAESDRGEAERCWIGTAANTQWVAKSGTGAHRSDRRRASRIPGGVAGVQTGDVAQRRQRSAVMLIHATDGVQADRCWSLSRQFTPAPHRAPSSRQNLSSS